MKETLQADERRLRQEAITAEVVELAAGLRSLRA
jgi:F-type H+-transporting ATPase subunit gamma